MLHIPQYIFWNREVHLATETIVDNNEIVHHEADRMNVKYSVDRDTGTTTYDLSLKVVEPTDSGKYVCSSTDSFTFDNENSKTYHLKVESSGKDVMLSLNSVFVTVCLLFTSYFS